MTMIDSLKHGYPYRQNIDIGSSVFLYAGIMRFVLFVLLSALFLLGAESAVAQQATNQQGFATPAGPLGIQLSVDGGDSPQTLSTTIKILLLMTALSVAPSALLMVTGFTRIMIVMGIARRAIGLQSAPPNQVIAGLALFLTLFLMRPIWQDVMVNAWEPYNSGEISEKEAWDRATRPFHSFMLLQTGDTELKMFHDIAGEELPDTAQEVKLTVLVPAFMVSEMKTAFQMGFLIWLPFLVIDLVLASSLMSLGMMMLPPMMISLPIKILFFVLADGWTLIVRGLMNSFM